MTQIIFQSSAGVVRFGGGGKDAWRMTEVSGLGMSGKSFQTVVYSSEAGQRTIGEQRSRRIITIGGDVCGGSHPVSVRIADAVKALDKPGWLTVRHAGICRRIWARCSALEQGQRKGAFRTFRVQFCCDSPFFEELEPRKTALFERKNEIKTTFCFPCVMSERTSRGSVVNSGDAEAEPVFDIYFGENAQFDKAVEITLYNRSTGEKLTVSYLPEAGEVVTIDIPQRRIFNNKGENLISILADDSYMSLFTLAEGVNIMEAVCGGTFDFSIICRFTNRFLESVC